MNQSPGMKGRDQFGRVEHGEPAGRARSDVVHPVPAAQRGDRQVDQSREFGQYRGDGAGHGRVLRVDLVEDVQRGQLVDVGRRRIAEFRW
jgi:hypothetical protein